LEKKKLYISAKKYLRYLLNHLVLIIFIVVIIAIGGNIFIKFSIIMVFLFTKTNAYVIKIKKNSYIYNKNTNNILILGSCCIKKFCKNEIKKTCELCNEPHRNRLKKRCNKCKLIKIYSGFCTDCDKKIDTKYMKSFQCFNIKTH